MSTYLGAPAPPNPAFFNAGKTRTPQTAPAVGTSSVGEPVGYVSEEEEEEPPFMGTPILASQDFWDEPNDYGQNFTYLDTPTDPKRVQQANNFFREHVTIRRGISEATAPTGSAHRFPVVNNNSQDLATVGICRGQDRVNDLFLEVGNTYWYAQNGFVTFNGVYQPNGATWSTGGEQVMFELIPLGVGNGMTLDIYKWVGGEWVSQIASAQNVTGSDTWYFCALDATAGTPVEGFDLTLQPVAAFP